MKTKNIIITNLFIAIAVVFASCSTSVEIAKRTFNNGYYVHVITNKKVESAKENNEVAKKNPENVSIPDMKDNNTKNSYSDIQNVKSINSVAEITKNTIENSTVASMDKKPVLSSKKNISFKPEETNSVKSSKADFKTSRNIMSVKETRKFIRHNLFHHSDVPTIVLILLCIFLPFIAVGLVDDWGIRFLISIVLTLLFWFPGIIYAFIVCFA